MAKASGAAVDQQTVAASRFRERPRGKTARLIGGVVGISLAIFGAGFLAGRSWEVPGPTAFWTIAAQPLATATAGFFAIAAATVALYGVHVSNRESRARTDAEIKQRDIAAQIGELWKRFEWVVENVSKPVPESSAIDERQATDIVIAIRDAADSCGDTHLSQMLDVYMGSQLNDLSGEVGLKPAGLTDTGNNEGEA
ncbi:Uncharacterised protein [Mycobacteroides abscessus subsp. abscessus]|nr:Uncharacterised protein [Mycobacteroides abscessus subsp. abscessus]SLJ80627.1 Uncharacterised protein [Mycobacteroides abscessus subsp. abscessus]